MSWARGALGAALVYVGVTVALTYPLVTRLTSAVPSDPGDPLLNAWILWWNAQTVPFTSAWWNAPAFFPSVDSLALSEHLLGLSFLTSPIIWTTGNTQLAYNVAFLLTFILSGLGGHALGYVLTGRHDAALICGLAYAFAPYRMGQFPHIQVLASFWMPMALAALHRFLRDERWPWLLIFALTAMLQALTMGHYALFFPVLIGVWVLWYPAAQRRARAVAAIAAAFALANVPVVIALLHYAEVHRSFGLSRHIDEVLSYSADVTALVRGEPNLRLWGGVLLEPAPEGQLFPGLTGVALVIAALAFATNRGFLSSRAGSRAALSGMPAALDGNVRLPWAQRALTIAAVAASIVALALPILGAWHIDLLGATLSVRRISRPISVALVLWVLVLLSSRRFWTIVKSQSALGFYVAATVVMWVLAFGPHPTFEGQRVVYWAPYRWLMLLPGFSGIRVPARFGMLAALCLAAAASVAFARLLTRAPARLRAVLTAVVALSVVADGWIRAMPLAEQPTASVLTAASAPGAVLELPIAEVDVAAMYRSMAHRHPVANGYSGYSPPSSRMVRSGLESFEPDMLMSVAAVGVRHIVVWHGDPARTTEWNAYVQRVPGVSLVETKEGQSHYTIAPPSRPPELHSAADSEVPIAWVRGQLYSQDIGRLRDGDLKTSWKTGARQRGLPEEHVIVGLDVVARVAGVRLALGDFPTAYPRAVLIERSLDCMSWEPLWSGPTASLALSAVLLNPVTVPLTVRFEPVEARCIAIRQTGSTPHEHWAVAELSLLGPKVGRSEDRPLEKTSP